MVERMVEDILESMAPRLLGSGTTYYMEEDFAAAYEGKICDAGIDYGNDLCLFEVVSGRLTIESRIAGSADAFAEDTEQVVLKKARQLHETASSLLADQRSLLGHEVPGLRILPVVVAAGGYAVNPISIEYLREQLVHEGLLTDPGVEDLAVIDLGELEMLEGLQANKGGTPVEVIRDWKSSPLARIELNNFLITGRPGADSRVFRPPRRNESIDRTVERLLERLALKN